jgi:hypothetical protein
MLTAAATGFWFVSDGFDDYCVSLGVCSVQSGETRRQKRPLSRHTARPVRTMMRSNSAPS